MTTALVASSLLLIVFAIIMTVVASKILHNKRARSAARIATLQALVAGPAGSPEDTEDFSAMEDEEDWDLALGEVRTSALAVAGRSAGQAELRTSNFEVRTSSSHPLFEEAAPRTPSRRLAWVVGVGLVMASAAGVMYAVSSGMIDKVLAPNTAATPTAAATIATPIELLSLRYAIEAPDTFVVTGLVQNPTASAELRGVTAVVYLFDAEGRYFASSRAALASSVLSPGGEAPFTVKVASSVSSLEDLSRYRVSFQLADGAAVRHVDRRGTLPEGTTGDAVEAKPPSPQTPLVTARKSR